MCQRLFLHLAENHISGLLLLTFLFCYLQGVYCFLRLLSMMLRKILSKSLYLFCLRYCILISDCLKDYKQSENSFIKATNIVPHRLYPFYLLTLLYHEMDLQDKVNEMADIVQTKEPKVQSTAVREMRQEVNKLRVMN